MGFFLNEEGCFKMNASKDEGCQRCNAFGVPYVPWSTERYCLGCYVATHPGEVLLQFPEVSFAQLQRTAPHMHCHMPTCHVRAHDLAAHPVFGGNMEMARGYHAACTQTASPENYVQTMRPFYSLLGSGNV